MVARAVARTSTTLDDRLLASVRAPLTGLFFLWGATVAIERLPLPARWSARVSSALFLAAVVLVAAALLRAWRASLAWYVAESRQAQEGGVAAEFGPLFSKLGTVFIILLTSIAALQHLGVDVASLVVSLGVGSLAVGLAAKDTLANMFAGFTLLLDRPFRAGDRILLASGELGDVEAVGMRATRIRTLDSTILVVPNSALVSERVVNQSRPGRSITTRIDVPVPYGTDLAQAKALLTQAGQACAYADPDRPPVAVVTRFAESAVMLRLIFWAKDYDEQHLAVSQAHENIDRLLREAGIPVAYPVRRILEEDA
jgi:small-conductance mechanosensitive channel